MDGFSMPSFTGIEELYRRCTVDDYLYDDLTRRKVGD